MALDEFRCGQKKKESLKKVHLSFWMATGSNNSTTSGVVTATGDKSPEKRPETIG